MAFKPFKVHVIGKGCQSDHVIIEATNIPQARKFAEARFPDCKIGCCTFCLNIMCGLLSTVLIVGAIEATPGVMTVDYIRKEKLSGLDMPAVEQVFVPTEQYLDCWE